MKSVTRLLLALSLFVGIAAAPGCGEKGKEAPPEKAKLQNTTPVDPDAEEPDAADSKPADAKPDEPTADSKPADPAPADPAPADPKPADPKANPDAKPKKDPKPAGSLPSN